MNVKSNTNNERIYVSTIDGEYKEVLGEIQNCSCDSYSLFKITGKAMVATRSFNVQEYATNEIVQVKNGDVLSEHAKLRYGSHTGLGCVCFGYREENSTVYVASLEELNLFTVPVYVMHDGSFRIVYDVLKQYRYLNIPFLNEFFHLCFGSWDDRSFENDKGFGSLSNLEKLFSMDGMDTEYLPKFFPLLGILHEFLVLQPEPVHEHFLPGILNILNDAKEMLNGDIEKDNKEILLDKTLSVMEKLRQSIHNVSPYNCSGVKDVTTAILQYYDMEKQKTEEKNKKMDDYISKINSRAELIDLYNKS